MELKDLIEAVESATTKDGLEALVLRELGIDVDKRKRLSDIRAEVLQGLGVEQGVESADAGDGAVSEEKSGSAAPSDKESAPSDPAGVVVLGESAVSDSLVDGLTANSQLVGLISYDSNAAIQPPAPEVDPPKPAIPEVKNRLLRNKSTGRTFVWTKELAKLSVMEEI